VQRHLLCSLLCPSCLCLTPLCLTPLCLTPLCLLPAAFNVFYYKSGIQGDVYVLNTKPTAFSAADLFCGSQGGRLVGYESPDEQNEAETYFVNQGFLLPYFHTSYLMGIKAFPWPQFNWTDK
jgi:hypothetical protein